MYMECVCILYAHTQCHEFLDFPLFSCMHFMCNKSLYTEEQANYIYKMYEIKATKKKNSNTFAF